MHFFIPNSQNLKTLEGLVYLLEFQKFMYGEFINTRKVVTHVEFRASLGNVLEEESSLIFLDFEENPHLGEERKSNR